MSPLALGLTFWLIVGTLINTSELRDFTLEQAVPKALVEHQTFAFDFSRPESIVCGDVFEHNGRRFAVKQPGAFGGTAIPYLALPGFVWVEIEASPVEVDGRLEVFGVAKAAGRLLDALDYGVESLEARIGQAMAQASR